MHPPLHRPHPDCQEAIKALEHCQNTRHWLNVFKCNTVKAELDQCFRKEKQEMLKKVNENWAEKEEIRMREMGLVSWEEHRRLEKEKADAAGKAK
eukprot:CAMPEP_0196814568 /NCGR_PEP_ID=MMETSP1362-20130617/44243_1 /TAXON_ID=163516 /ORGANISM="Leptocylindrus danicus, Strain CCMP1856" /LENGTH=94 /DNA_ID=CAMNT_0042191225 /DNA_START=9 /DNA_END=296 /DNA_ORIENTATION=-